ncbi:MAG: PAS domain-containing sensor histidine kinase [Gammaproteobacteria bacterium]
MRASFEGKLVLLGLLALLVAGGVGFYVFSLSYASDPKLALSLSLLSAIVIWLVGSRRLIRPAVDLITTLKDNVASMKDSDFSVSIANLRHDELGDLVNAHNELGGVLRQERQSLYQRELLLDTVIQTTTLALVLVDANKKIVYSNAAARTLLWQGKPLNGELFEHVLSLADKAFKDAVTRSSDGLFTIEGDEPQTFHLSRSDFTLNVRNHRLYLFKHLTQELNRQEVATWKKVIRVISHELNNSLAPISSMAHSGSVVHQRGSDSTADKERLETIFATIEERARHLKDFIEGYARFARLPAPRIETVEWEGFLDSLKQTIQFQTFNDLPAGSVRMDPGQMEQVLINLLKNAHESGSAPEDVTLDIQATDPGWRIVIGDLGTGMSQTVLASALLPFYSTKKTGSGLGLPLCREIVEAHGGRMSLANRSVGGLMVTIQLPG